MPDRSPQKPSGKKPGKSLKEKREAKKGKREERENKGSTAVWDADARCALLSWRPFRGVSRHATTGRGSSLLRS